MCDTLEDLLDKKALDEIIFQAMHAMDSRDWPSYRAVITEDSEFDFRDHGVATDDAVDVMRGGDAYLAVLASVIEGFDSTQHTVSNILHKLDGDRADTRCYICAEHFLNNDRGGRRVTCGGRYEIQSVRTAEGWKIHRLRFKTFWFDGNTSLYALAGKAVADRAK